LENITNFNFIFFLLNYFLFLFSRFGWELKFCNIVDWILFEFTIFNFHSIIQLKPFLFVIISMSWKRGPNVPAVPPSDAQAREKLALYVYEYLLHIGAKNAAQTFLQEIRWDKQITLGDPPGFLCSWWCVFWDLYCAAPERRDSSEHSNEAKAFHDYGFVNSGYAVNGIHGPGAAPSPLAMPPQAPDSMPSGPGGLGPPHGFFQPGVPGPHMRPSPPQQNVSQQSPHSMLNQQNFMGARYPSGPPSRPGPALRLAQEPQPPFGAGQVQPIFPEQLRPGAPPPHMMPPQRLPPGGPGSHARLAPMPQSNFSSNIRPMNNPGLAPALPPGTAIQRSWPSSMHFGEPGPSVQYSGPGMPVSNGPVGGPGTPIMPSPQNMPCDGAPPDRYGMMQVGAGPPPMGVFPMTSEPGNVGISEMMINGDGLDIKNSPSSSSHGLNGGTPGPAGPNSVSSAPPPDSCALDYSSTIPFQSSDQEAEIQKIKESICEESKLFESKDGVPSEGPNDFFGMH
ncbi:Single-stranded DNA-binding protein 3, partial [Trichinella spiralis]